MFFMYGRILVGIFKTEKDLVQLFPFGFLFLIYSIQGFHSKYHLANLVLKKNGLLVVVGKRKTIIESTCDVFL